MAEILEFGKKAQDLKSLRDETTRQRKIDAIRKIFQCTRCMMKCAKCGTQLDSDAEERSNNVAPFNFCTNCSEEYQEYKDRLSGELPRAKYYWHNDPWMKVWQSWLEHQKYLDEYRQSKEFLQLLQEVEELLGSNR